MVEITKVYRESLPSLRLIGKRYTNSDRGADGGHGVLSCLLALSIKLLELSFFGI